MTPSNHKAGLFLNCISLTLGVAAGWFASDTVRDWRDRLRRESNKKVKEGKGI